MSKLELKDPFPAELGRRLDMLSEHADTTADRFGESVERRPSPKYLYHYTNDLGLRGLLESGTFWLTDIFSLNDPSELSHSFSLALKILRDASDEAEEVIFTKKFESFLESGGLQASAHYFVSSFSAHGDDLEQWRAYADDGRGFILVFDREKIEKTFISQYTAGNSAFEVTYDDARLRQMYLSILSEAVPLISAPLQYSLKGDVKDAFLEELSSILTVYVIRLAVLFKHESYKNEKEYRFLQIHPSDVLPAPGVKYRHRPYSLVRYREFPWKPDARDALLKIIAGPAAGEKAFLFAKDCLRAFHNAQVEVGISKVPYRTTREL